VKKKNLLKLKKKKSKIKIKLKDKLLKYRFFYKISISLKTFIHWFNHLNNAIIVIVLLITFALITIFNTWIKPPFNVQAQHLSVLKARGFRSINFMVLIVLYWAILNFLEGIWCRYKKKPLGDIFRRRQK
jgi:hypothetical protein